MALRSLCLLISVAACAHAPSQGGSRPTPRAEHARQFTAQSTFAELVASIRALEADAAADQGCLFGKDGDTLVLGATLAPAVHPLLAPPVDLDGQAGQATRATVLTRYGRLGQAASGLLVGALTAAPPTRSASVLVLTERGTYVLETGADRPQTAPSTDGQAVAALGALSAERGLYLTAEAGVSVGRLVSIVEALAAHGATSVALALPLGPQATLRDDRLPSAVDSCAEGIEPGPDDLGELPAETLRAALLPLRESASRCLEGGSGPSALSEHLELSVAIGGDGAVRRACVVKSEYGDAEVLSCVLGALRGLSFPTSAMGGTVIAFPLTLVGRPGAPEPALCPATR